MTQLAALALTLAPELAGALFGPNAQAIGEAVAAAVARTTGTSQAEAAQQAIGRDPDMAAALRVELARIAAAAGEASRGADLRALMAQLAPPAATTRLAWAAPAISAVVLVAFGAAVWAALSYPPPPGSETEVTMLLGTLAAMATSVVSYWVGSSAGSAAKTELLFRAQPPSPVGPVTAHATPAQPIGRP
jgi:hypothetical protein